MEKKLSNKERILEEAIKVFAEKGKHGAHMEEVAARADINKAMVYYYYTSKENLFLEVLTTILYRAYTRIREVYEAGNPPEDDPLKQLELFLRAQFLVFAENNNHAKILTDSIVGDREVIRTAIQRVTPHTGIIETETLKKIIYDGRQKGIFRKVNFMQSAVSIVSMGIIYYMSIPIAQTVMGLSVEDEEKFMRDRESATVDMVLSSIVKR